MKNFKEVYKFMKTYKRIFIGKIIILIVVCLLFSLIFANISFGKTRHLSIVTAGATGTYYPIGAALSKVIKDNVPQVFAAAEVSGGSIENMKLVSRGEADIGIANQMHFKIAISGKPPFEKPITNLRTLFPLSGTNYVMKHAWQIIVLDKSPIQSIYDIRGKRVAVGPAGSGTEVYTKRILDSLGIKYDDLVPLFYSYSEATSAMRDGTIDACIFHSAVPTGAVIELAATRNIRMIPINSADIKKLKEEWGFNRREVSVEEYNWLKQNVQTVVACYHVIFVNKEMDSELVYKIVKAAMENKEVIWASNPGAKGYDEMGVVIGLDNPPLHLGSLKYFQEIGIEVPEKVIPPEAK